jgi:Ring finger domain
MNTTNTNIMTMMMKSKMFISNNKLIDSAARHKRIMVQNKCGLSDECAVCLESVFGRKVMYLPCKHYFHHDCLIGAFANKLYTCPLCRHNLIQPLIKIGFFKPTIYYAYGYHYVDDANNEEESEDEESDSEDEESDSEVSGGVGLQPPEVGGVGLEPPEEESGGVGLQPPEA